MVEVMVSSSVVVLVALIAYFAGFVMGRAAERTGRYRRGLDVLARSACTVIIVVGLGMILVGVWVWKVADLVAGYFAKMMWPVGWY